MRIVFTGTVDFSRHCLEEVLRMGGDIVGILTLEKENAQFNSDYADLGPVADKYGVPIYRIKNINDHGTIAHIKNLDPDVIFVFGFSQLIKKEILDIPPLGCIGAHPALLPKNRGRHPLIWALIEDLKDSGLTFFYLDEGADSGDILWQKTFRITDEDDAGTLYDRIKILATEGIREFLPRLQSGSAPRIPQDHSLATYWRKRGEEDGEIVWTGTTRQVFNLVRALTRPYVGAHTFKGENRILIWRSRIIPRPERIPEYRTAGAGEILSEPSPAFFVRTGDGVLEVMEWETGRKVILGKGTVLKGAKQ